VAHAHEAMVTAFRSLLPHEIEAREPDALLRATYEHLLPAGRVDLEQISALGRIGDVCRAFADRDLPVPEGLVEAAVNDAKRLLEGLPAT